MPRDVTARYAGAAEALARSARTALTLLLVGVPGTPLVAAAAGVGGEGITGASVRAYLFGSLLLLLFLDGGLVDGRRRSATALLWAQKPGWPEGHFVRSVLVLATLSTLLILALGGATALTTWAASGSGHTVLRAVPGVLFRTWMLVLFMGTSAAWGSGRPAALALVLYFGLMVLAIRMALAPESFGALRGAVAPLVLPMDEVGFLLEWDTLGTGVSLAEAGRRVATYVATWILLGGVGLVVTRRTRVGGG